MDVQCLICHPLTYLKIQRHIHCNGPLTIFGWQETVESASIRSLLVTVTESELMHKENSDKTAFQFILRVDKFRSREI